MALAIPGPSSSWFHGNLVEFRSGMLPFFEKCRREFGQVAAFRLGWRRLILVSDPSLIEEVLVTKNKSFKKHFATRLLQPVLGEGLLLSEGDSWLRQRRLIQPAFSRRFSQDFMGIVDFHTEKLAAQWRTDPRRDLYHDMTQLTVQIAADAFLGIRESSETEEIGDSLETIHADFEHRFLQAWNPPLWVPTARNRELRRAVGQLTTLIDRMIEFRRSDAGDGHDALSLLLRAEDEDGNRMPLQLLRDEVMTLLLAGHDTTANGLTWTWFLLAQNPDVMSNLQEMLQQKTTGEPMAESCPLAQQIVKESMRMFPPVYVFGREAVRDIEIGGYGIRKGDNVIMSQWIVHRDEQYYPDPNRFWPERWTTDFEKQLPKYAYFPFSGGPRVCIGKHVAMIEAERIVTKLASEFNVKLERPDDVEPWPTVTLRPKDAVWATMDPR